MLGGAYSQQFQNVERQHVDTIKTLAENEKHDAIARAKKLSIETNKRRRALAIKRKSEAEKEEKRRQHILAKRRERQNEATERFQRGHISGSRPSSGTSSTRWSPSPRNTAASRLDEALKLVRGSPSNSRQSSSKSQGRTSPNTYYRQNSDPLSKPYFNKYAHPSINQTLNGYEKKDDLHSKSLRNLNNSRTLFEQQLQSHQQSLLNQQQKALQDFNKQIMREIEVDKNVVNAENNGNGEERSESLSTVDSLEDTESNDTLRESCDIDRFITLQNGDASDRNDNSKNDSRNGYQYINSQINGGNVSNAHSTGNSNRTQTIDSFNTQVQSYYNQAAGQDQKQQQYYQRQLEIQQQLQEQQEKQLMQQKQKEDMDQKIWEQQQKQKQLLQQQYQKQQQEQQEKQRQQELERQRQQELLEKQRQQQEHLERQRAERLKHQEMIEKQKLQEEHLQRLRQEAENQRLHLQQQARQNVSQPYIGTSANTEVDNQRPKVQMKAWATPSPHPPTPASAVTTTPLVTNTSPYTGKPTHTNVTTTTAGGYDKTTTTTNSVYKKPSVSFTGTTTCSDTAATNTQMNKTPGKTVTIKTDQNQEQPNLSFLEAVTRDLTGTTNQDSPSEYTSAVSRNHVNNDDSKLSMSSPKTTVTNTNVVKPQISPAVGKPSAYYKGSYGANFTANKQQASGQQGTFGESGRQYGTGAHGVGFTDRHLELIPGPGLNGDDTADTDSVSTICEEKEPEPKEVKSILKRTGSANKKTGILKKAGSTGNMDIRDSLEITRVHLQTPAEEREQKMLRELERAQNPPPPPPTKKNVRFADLCYDAESEDSHRDGEDDQLFVKRKEDSDRVANKPPRPVSAVALKTNSIQMNAKPPRASSASTVRMSTIPRSKTQVVRPQATAHIITQNNQGGASEAESKKKVTIVNNDFMQKVPAMARNNQTVHTATPASVYSAMSVTQPRPQDQKMNYAVSSIIMPKSNSAPFIYPGYPKQGLAPTGSTDGPSEASNSSKYDGAMFDENGLRIDRTPTDDEINFLWDKLKSCLSRNTSTGDKSPTDGHRQAAPVSNTYIDGNALGQYNSLNRVAQPQMYNGLRRQNSLDSAGNTYAKRYGLLQQRRQQPNPNSLKSRQAASQLPHAPVPSHTDPQLSPAGGQPGPDVSESMAGFLVAEQLADQSVADSAIHQAIDDAQARQQAFHSGRPQAKVMSALSIEEQHVLESLDKLNEKLKVSDVPIPNGNAALAPVPREQQTQLSPHQHHPQHQHHQQHQQHKPVVHMGGFKGHTPISQRRVIESATHKARLRITSACLKRNAHRNQ